jgi:DTW domain-containing protein
MHTRELLRPSSTGHLLGRIVAGARLHEWLPESPPRREDVVQPGRELWILHPQGDAPPADLDPFSLQVLLLDASWVQATDMAHAVAPWGRRVRLPMRGESRYWLRRQAGEGKFSTAESLLFLLESLGLAEAAADLRAQFELHVWGTLLSRGKKARAAEYLADSPVGAAFPAVVEALTGRSPGG